MQFVISLPISVLAVDPELRDLAALRLVHELDERVFSTFERFEIVHRSVGVHARELSPTRRRSAR